MAAGLALTCGLAASLLCLLLAPVWTAVLAGSAGIAAASALLYRPGGVPILVYHSVSPEAGWLPWAANTSVRPETFRRHLEILKRDCWSVVSTMDLVAARQQGRPLPLRTAVLHFDDGYLDNFLFAAPLLREFGMPATFFASLDFIETGDALRSGATGSGPAAWTGYTTASELRAMDADPLFLIEAHGVDHARVPVSDRTVGQVGADDWRRHAPLAWALDTGNKARWFECASPPACLRPGAALPESDSTLTGRWWRDGAAESASDHAARVSAALARAHAGLAQVLARPPRVMAWPFDRSTGVAIAAARAVGFVAVTGGCGENRPDEDPTILSRVHVQDHAFGGGPLWLEGLAFRARLNSAAGRWAWHIVVVLAAHARRRHFGQPGYGAAS